MDTFELDSDAFYICTEVSPRNFIVQKAIQIDKSQIERMIGKFDGKTEGKTFVENQLPETSSGLPSVPFPGTPPSTSASGFSSRAPPVLPYWFNRECKTRLMMIGPQPHDSVVTAATGNNPYQFIPSIPPPMTREEIKQQLKFQLEYYFSRENLITDRYLKCQMDSDQYVQVTVLAGFRKIENLTSDLDLIVEAAKESTLVELDENEEKVRAITKRTTIIIREIPEECRDEVLKLLADGPPFADLKYDSNESWYVTYENELDTQVAYVSVQHKKNEITGRQVCARIKAGGPPSAAPTDVRNGENGRLAAASGDTGTIQMREIGQTLSDYGFVPVATYRPGDPMMNVYEYVTPTFSFRGNNIAFMAPPPPASVTPPQHLEVQHQHPVPSFYYNTPTSARNFDELSSASSTSTRTSSSHYRSASRNGVGNQNNYNESRGFSNSVNSNEWRARGNSGGSDQRRFQNNQNQNENKSNRPPLNGRGSWRGGYRNGTNGHNNQNNRPNGHNNWRHEQNGHTQNWRSNETHTYYQSNNVPHPSSSSSSTSSKYFSPDAIETPTNSLPNTPPPSQQVYTVPTPTDLPPPPVWPAPSFDKRRKSSETSLATVVPNSAINTLTPSTPVTPPVFRPDLQVKNQSPEVIQTIPQQHSELNANIGVSSPVSVRPTEKTQSPSFPVSPPVTAPSFSFEDEAFPSLPKMPESEKKVQKPTFSSIVIGRRSLKQLPPEKTSYAEKLKLRQPMSRH